MGIKSILSPSIRFHIMFSTIFKLYNLSSCMTCLFPLGDYFTYTQNPDPLCISLYVRLEAVIEELYALISFCLILSATGEELAESCFIRFSSRTPDQLERQQGRHFWCFVGKQRKFLLSILIEVQISALCSPSDILKVNSSFLMVRSPNQKMESSSRYHNLSRFLILACVIFIIN